MRKFEQKLISAIALIWALFQLALPKLILLDSIRIRAIHLAFALLLVFLISPVRKRGKIRASKSAIPWYDYLLAIAGVFSALYLVLFWLPVSARSGSPNLPDTIFSIILILILLEAARRQLGAALSIIVVFFTAYAFLGPWLPYLLAFRGVSLDKYLSQIALSTEGIYGIPLDVSAVTVFLFVLFGSLLEKTGAGLFFNDLSLSLLGRYKGGPAKAAVVSSGLTGIVSGSSIANVVTTGTFTIPLMKKVGYPAEVAAATEVAASTNGQLMPPIMGAAAFIIAEYLGLPYLQIVKAAALPAVISYLALFYITHLEASKLGMKGLSRSDLPRLVAVVRTGFHHLIPLLILLYQLIILRHTPQLSAFNSILSLILITLLKDILEALRTKSGIWTCMRHSFVLLGRGLIAGSRNMLSVALATAAAGIVVGIVNMGIGSLIVQIVESLSGGNIFVLLLISALASLILGMGLPTTATYIVMASITVPVIIKISHLYGLHPVPAIAAHLFCFYFGILADDTPPVGLAAYTAAAIADSDPIRTGIKAFSYDLRTAIIPFMFVFNPALLLLDVNSFWEIILIFILAALGIFSFTNAVQGWFITRNRWWELPIFLVLALVFFQPALLRDLLHLPAGYTYLSVLPAMVVYLLLYFLQKKRLLRNA